MNSLLHKLALFTATILISALPYSPTFTDTYEERENTSSTKNMKTLSGYQNESSEKIST